MDNLFTRLPTQNAPLAERLRPKNLDEVIGQEKALGAKSFIRQMVLAKKPISIILWGPPGCGKTTIARVIAKEIGLEMEHASAVQSGVSDLKLVIDRARIKKETGNGKSTLLFVDEIHRFNRAQQDVLLPVVEDGTITLIGATTENPSFEVNSALLSRCHVVTLLRLERIALGKLLERAESAENKNLPLNLEAREILIEMCDGDGRSLLNFAEALFEIAEKEIDAQGLSYFLQRRAPIYDKAQDSHYNLISALHKSLRGSDVDASLYWFCRMIEGGEDPLYIARRLVRFAVEDIGMADPQALVQANSAKEAYHFLGSPEGELAIAQSVVYLATAPKSNAVYSAYKSAIKSAQKNGSLMPPKHILNAPTKFMKNEGYGKGYEYDHNTETGFSGQNYFPENMNREEFYKPFERGFERDIIKRLDYWKAIREKKK